MKPVTPDWISLRSHGVTTAICGNYGAEKRLKIKGDWFVFCHAHRDCVPKPTTNQQEKK
jgi:hypothetical protein